MITIIIINLFESLSNKYQYWMNVFDIILDGSMKLTHEEKRFNIQFCVEYFKTVKMSSENRTPGKSFVYIKNSGKMIIYHLQIR